MILDIEDDVVPVEVVAPEPTAEIVKTTGLPVADAQLLGASFSGLFQRAKEVVGRSRGIVVTDAKQKLEMKMARESRLELRRIRIDGEKTKKTLKEDSLRRGRAIDGFYNILVEIIGAEEKRLDDQEKFIERMEAAQKEELRATRAAALAKYDAADEAESRFDLANMDEATFAKLLDTVKAAAEMEEERKRKDEAERIEREKAEAEERKRMAEENARLKKEAVEREAAAQKEREALEAKAREEKRKADEAARVAAEQARKEREAREKAERELAAQRKAEEDRLRAEAEKARKAAAAPDKEKLLAFAAKVRALEVPEMATEEGSDVAATVSANVRRLAEFIEGKAGAL